MKVVNVPVGAVTVDSLPFSMGGGAAEVSSLKAAGVQVLVGYLGAMSKARLDTLLAGGLGYIPVTFAGEYEDGAGDELSQLAALGIPKGTTVFLDLEGQKAFKTPAPELITKIDAWATAITAAGYIAGLYVGVPQPLTSDELWKLKVSRYWRGQGSVRDRTNALAEPTGCGWCMTQAFPSVARGGVLVDVNLVGQDYKGRVPTMVVA